MVTIRERALSAAVRLVMLGWMVVVLPTVSNAGDKIPTWEGVRWLIDGSEHASQTKGKVTIDVTIIDSGNAYDYPQIFAFTDEDIAASGARGGGGQGGFDINVWKFFPEDFAKKRWINILSDPNEALRVPAFWVKVRNETEHIMNFSKDVRMFVQLTGVEEPQGPVKDLTAELFPKLLAWEKSFEATRKKGFLSVSYPVGLAAMMFNHRFGRWQETSFQNKDTLPGMSSSGLILFNGIMDSKATDEVTLMLYEVPTDTDAAGTVTAKSRFTFRFTKAPQKFWYDQKTGRGVLGDPPAQ